MQVQNFGGAIGVSQPTKNLTHRPEVAGRARGGGGMGNGSAFVGASQWILVTHDKVAKQTDRLTKTSTYRMYILANQCVNI